jgi:hypothetical protein
MLVCSCAAVANHIPACVCFWTPDARLGLGAICVCFYACFYALDACVFVYFWAFCVFWGAMCVCVRAIFVCFCAFLCARACAFGAAQGVRCGRWGLKGSLLRNLGNHSLSQSALSLCASSLPALSRSLARSRSRSRFPDPSALHSLSEALFYGAITSNCTAWSRCSVLARALATRMRLGLMSSPLPLAPALAAASTTLRTHSQPADNSVNSTHLPHRGGQQCDTMRSSVSLSLCLPVALSVVGLTLRLPRSLSASLAPHLSVCPSQITR